MVGLNTIIMKKIFTIISLLMISTLLFAQAQKTYVKSFPMSSNTVLLEVEGSVEVVEWDESFARVQTTVTIENGNSEVLRSLMLLGRYQVEEVPEDRRLVLTSVSRKKEVSVRGRLLVEEVSYTVFVPRYVEVHDLNVDRALATARSLSD